METCVTSSGSAKKLYSHSTTSHTFLEAGEERHEESECKVTF